MYILKSVSFIILILLFCILLNGCCTYLGYTLGYKAGVRTGVEIKESTDLEDIEYDSQVTVFCDDDTIPGIYQGFTDNSLLLRRFDRGDSIQYILKENINNVHVFIPGKKTYRTLGTIIGLTCDTILLWLIFKDFNPVSGVRIF